MKINKQIVNNRLAIPEPGPLDRFTDPCSLFIEKGKRSKRYPKSLKGFQYHFAATNITAFPHLEYTNCEPDNYKSGLDVVNKNRKAFFTDPKLTTITSSRGWAGAKGNTCISYGEVYFEVEIKDPRVRIGIARRETSCGASVGCDQFSYGIVGETGCMVHCARQTPFTKPLRRGDIVGFHVNVPVDFNSQMVVRNRIPIKYRDKVWLESRNYRPAQDALQSLLHKNYKPPNENELIKNSFCKVYVNGELVGDFGELRDYRPPNSIYEHYLNLEPTNDGLLGYYPMISAFRGGEAKLLTGPEFTYPPPVDEPQVGEPQPQSDVSSLDKRFKEQIADDVLTDLLDDILYEQIDTLRDQHMKEPRSSMAKYREVKVKKQNVVLE